MAHGTIGLALGLRHWDEEFGMRVAGCAFRVARCVLRVDKAHRKKLAGWEAIMLGGKYSS
jgi:hypothetical protein